jgi:membrane protease YdiL (CAAX protease family)
MRRGGPAETTFAVAVAGTAAAGALLSWLRERTGRLAAPVLLHAAVNSGALFAAHTAAARNRRRPAPLRWRGNRPAAGNNSSRV